MTIGRLAAWLVARGLVDPAGALMGNLSLVDSSRSNPVMMVLVDGHPKLVVKQRGPAIDQADPLAGEAATYHWLREHIGANVIAPRLVLDAVADGILVFEALAGVLSIHEALSEPGIPLDELFFSLGQVLGVLHATPIGSASMLAGGRPWVLGLPTAGPPSPFVDDAAVVKIVKQIVADNGLRAIMQQLAESWVGQALIHNDVKFDNALASRTEQSRCTGVPTPVGKQGDARVVGWTVWLVDWELAGLGDPAWDLVSVVEGILTHQILTKRRVNPAEAGLIARSTLRGHRSVVDGYLDLTPMELMVALPARVAQTAVQLAMMERTDPAYGDLASQMVQLATRLARDQRHWARELFGTAP